jgi:cytochrome b6-f complex iron-sulfur subunit
VSEEVLVERKTMSRRRFLLYAWAVSGLIFAGEAGVILLNYVRPQAKEGAFGGKITAGEVEEFPVGSISYIREGRFFLSHLEGGFLAMSRVCPHLGCVVLWDEEESHLLCPCHAGILNERGEVVTGPIPRPLDLYPVEIIENEIVVDTGNPIVRAEFDESQLAS